MQHQPLQRLAFAVATSRLLTQCCWQSPEHKAIGILEEADPLHATLLPALHQPCAVQQCMYIAMPMGLLLYDVWIILLQCQVSIIVS